MNLPKLLYTTKEGRRVYPFQGVINGRQLTEIHIDPHWEEDHADYMSDELIYKLAWQLVQVEEWFVVEERKENWEYFSFDRLFQAWKAYKIVFCLQDGASFLGVRTCHRYRKNYKNDNKEEKQDE
jgi:hypothetical protein